MSGVNPGVVMKAIWMLIGGIVAGAVRLPPEFRHWKQL